MHSYVPMKLLSIVILATAIATASAISSEAQSPWTAPSPRKAHTPFAPKPHKGNNIFRGPADLWLADSIEKLEGGVFTPLTDRAVNDYVSEVGNYIATYSAAPTKPHKFIVTVDGSPDAMTAGGGRIYISIGMLELLGDEDQLAAVLAHEIAHDAFAHAAKTVTRQMFWMTGTRKVETPADVESALAKLLEEYQKKPIAAIGEQLLGFARADELEADRAAFYNTYKAGYNPLALRSALKLMAAEHEKREGRNENVGDQLLILLFGSHPPTTQRMMALSWEANFVKMPPRTSRVKSPSFDAMRKRIKEENK